MTDKTKLSEEVDNYFKMRKEALKEVSERITTEESDFDRALKMDGLGFNMDQKESYARITIGVHDIDAFLEELRSRGESWVDHLNELPDNLQEQVRLDVSGLIRSGAVQDHSRIVITFEETGLKFPLWFTQVIYQNDDPIMEAFYIGHEEGHVLHQIGRLQILYTLWTEHSDQLVNSECLNLKKDALQTLLNTAGQMESMNDNPVVTEAVAHLGGLYAAFLRYDPQVAVPEISPGTDTDEFRHVIWLLGYNGEYVVGCEEMRRARKAIYSFGDTGYQLQQPNFTDEEK